MARCVLVYDRYSYWLWMPGLPRWSDHLRGSGRPTGSGLLRSDCLILSAGVKTGVSGIWESTYGSVGAVLGRLALVRSCTLIA